MPRLSNPIRSMTRNSTTGVSCPVSNQKPMPRSLQCCATSRIASTTGANSGSVMFSGIKPQCVMIAAVPIWAAKSAHRFSPSTRSFRYCGGTIPSVVGPSVNVQDDGPAHPAQTAQTRTPVSADSRWTISAISGVARLGFPPPSWQTFSPNFVTCANDPPLGDRPVITPISIAILASSSIGYRFPALSGAAIRFPALFPKSRDAKRRQRLYNQGGNRKRKRSMLVDTHCHFNHERFAEDLPECLERAQAADVWQMIVVGYDLPSSE